MTQTLTVCTGIINSGGFCEKCWQPAQTTSNQCGRLVPAYANEKQQSIEEAAETYAKGVSKNDTYKTYLFTSFVTGAKSQAAKEYWYEQFKREQI